MKASIAGASATKGFIGSIAAAAGSVSSASIGGLVSVGSVVKGISTAASIANFAGIGASSVKAVDQGRGGVSPTQAATRTSEEVSDEESKRKRALLSQTGRASTIRAGVFAQRPALAAAGMLG
jgi:hypothetical protein